VCRTCFPKSHQIAGERARHHDLTVVEQVVQGRRRCLTVHSAVAENDEASAWEPIKCIEGGEETPRSGAALDFSKECRTVEHQNIEISFSHDRGCPRFAPQDTALSEKSAGFNPRQTNQLARFLAIDGGAATFDDENFVASIPLSENGLARGVAAMCHCKRSETRHR